MKKVEVYEVHLGVLPYIVTVVDGKIASVVQSNGITNTSYSVIEQQFFPVGGKWEDEKRHLPKKTNVVCLSCYHEPFQPY